MHPKPNAQPAEDSQPFPVFPHPSEEAPLDAGGDRSPSGSSTTTVESSSRDSSVREITHPLEGGGYGGGAVVGVFPLLKDTSSFHFDFMIFGTNSFCAFALNLAVFLLFGKTSALIAFSWSVIKDTVTPINLFGYGLAFLGVAYYNHSKLQALKANEAQKKALQANEEAGRLLEEREVDGSTRKNETKH